MSMRYNAESLSTPASSSSAKQEEDTFPNASCLVCKPPRRSLVDGRELTWTLVSDLHLGAPDVDLKLLRRDLDAEPESRILLGGDLLDLIVPTDAKRFCVSTIHPRLHGCTDFAGALSEWLYELFEPYAHRIDFAGLGNHESEYLHRHHHDPLAATLRMLNKHLENWQPRRPPIFYGGLCSWICYEIEVTRGKYQPLNLFYHHGWGRGGGTAAFGQFNSLLQRVEGADLFWLGHFHTPLTTRMRRLQAPSGKNEEGLREVHFVRSGAYRETYSKPLSQKQLKTLGFGRNYAAAQMMSAQSMGAARITLCKDSSPRGFSIVTTA